MKKAVLSVLILSLTLLFAVSGLAESISNTVSLPSAPRILSIPGGYSNDELFEAWMNRSSAGGISVFGGYDNLNDAERKVFDQLQAFVREIAAGDRVNTCFDVDLTVTGVKTLWEDSEFGELMYDPDEMDIGFIYDDLNQDLNMNLVLEALYRTSPESCYWISKKENEYSRYYPNINGMVYDNGLVAQLIVESYHFELYVDEPFRGASFYSFNTAKLGYVENALSTARTIVENALQMNDLDRMIWYMQEIRRLSEYNFPAAAPDYAGDSSPWQLITVFDGDPDTTVVCEGFAKAFKYLCDLSLFDDPELQVYCLTGGMGTLSTGEIGPHMWNLVVTATGSYLVDVTNCLTTGSTEDSLFFTLPTQAIENGYLFAIGESGFYYLYDEDTLNLFTEEELTLSDKPYVPAEQPACVTLRIHTCEDNICVTCGRTFVPSGNAIAILPEELTDIGVEALSGIAAETIVVPDDCKTILSKAFSACTGLKYIFLPASATVAEDALAGCDGVTLICR